MMHWALNIPWWSKDIISHGALWMYSTSKMHWEHIQLAKRTINHTRCNLSQNALRVNGHLAAAGSLWVAVGWRGQSVSWGGAGQWWTSPWRCHWAARLGQSWGCPSVDLNNTNSQLTAFHLSNQCTNMRMFSSVQTVIIVPVKTWYN